jgi:hypothetical protein
MDGPSLRFRNISSKPSIKPRKAINFRVDRLLKILEKYLQLEVCSERSKLNFQARFSQVEWNYVAGFAIISLWACSNTKGNSYRNKSVNPHTPANSDFSTNKHHERGNGYGY